MTFEPREFDFKAQLGMSQGSAIGADIEAILLDLVPGSTKIVKASNADDRSGTDYWCEHVRGTPVSVDTKIRKRDHGKDDLALETWSVVGKKIGWTLDEAKRTDYILWWWEDTRRFAFVPFLLLCHAFKKFKPEWEIRYRLATQPTVGTGGRRGWLSECMFVPRREVWAAMFKEAAGSRDPLYEYRTAVEAPLVDLILPSTGVGENDRFAQPPQLSLALPDLNVGSSALHGDSARRRKR